MTTFGGEMKTRLSLVVVAALLFPTATEASSTKLNDGKVGRSETELEAQLRHSTHVIGFFTRGRGRWMLHTRRESCWSVVGSGPRTLCRRSRTILRGHRWLRRLADERLAAIRAARSPIGSLSAWECIHGHEGSWTDSGDPFWGGLQMDRQFMYTYGRDMIARYGGFANLWSPRDQMVVAERARSSGRGYYPWPNTARMCGLI
jgi:hypothetical protein